MGDSKRYTIGGLGLTLSGGETLGRAAALPGFDRFRPEPTAVPSVHIGLDRSLALLPCRWLHRFPIADGQAEACFGIDAEGVYYHTFGPDAWLRYDSRQPDEVLCSSIGRPDVLRYALWTAYALAGLWHGAVPVHSSTVVCRHSAVMCLGESGTGKSTHTQLWTKHLEGCHLLNDDSPILRLDEGRLQVYGSPWSGKTPCYLQEHHPVAALLRLQQAPANSIRRLGTIEAFGALQPSCPPALAHDERCLDRLVAFISDVLSQAPVYRLQCLPDADAARLSFHTIYTD